MPNLVNQDAIDAAAELWAKQTVSAVQERKQTGSRAMGLPIQHGVASRLEARQRAAKNKLKAAADAAVQGLVNHGREQSDRLGGQADDVSAKQKLQRLEVHLDGQGVSEGRLRHRLKIMMVTLVLLASAGALFINLPESPERRIWKDYGRTAQQGGPSSLWLSYRTGAPRPLILADPGDFQVGEPLDIDGLALREVLSEIEGWVLIESLAAFVPSDQHDQVGRLLRGSGVPSLRLLRRRFVEAAGVKLHTTEELADHLEAAMGEEVAWVVGGLLLGTADSEDGVGHWRDLLLSGGMPDTFQIRAASGRRATAISPVGQRWHSSPLARWRGLVLLIRGDGWPQEARILYCHDVDDVDAERNPLRVLAEPELSTASVVRSGSG